MSALLWVGLGFITHTSLVADTFWRKDTPVGFNLPRVDSFLCSLCAMVADSGSLFLSDIVLLSALPCIIFIGALLWCINQAKVFTVSLGVGRTQKTDEVSSDYHLLQSKHACLQQRFAAMEVELEELRLELTHLRTTGSHSDRRSTIYVTTKSGKCWHADANCRHVKTNSAVSQYVPCTRCVRPGTLV